MILHLCVNYGDSRFYGKIFSGLNKHYTNTVFAPLRNKVQEDNAKMWYTKHYKLFADRKFKDADRFMQTRKTKKYFKYVTSQLKDIGKYNLIHAHSLFSDGSVAYICKKMYGTKYVVTVRNTDINIFWRYFIWRRPLGRKIVEGAEKIFVPSKSYQRKLENLFGLLSDRIVVIPNGIHNQFFEKSLVKKPFEKNLLFIGEFTHNKNILRLIDIVRDSFEWNLYVIGFGRLERRVENKCLGSENCHFIGFVSNKDEMIERIDLADVIVIPAKTELFGIALAESIARGRPIICMQGQGLDGFFNEGPVGIFLDNLTKQNLLNALNKIEKNYAELQLNCLNARETFIWDNIIERYRSEYDEALLVSK